MRTLITGGAGFIGTHLSRALIQAGHSVRVLDIRKPSCPVDGVEYMIGDVRVPEHVREATRDCEAVFHFAAIASVPLCQTNPYESSLTNLTSTAVVLENLEPGARFIFSSSASVYGGTGQIGEPISEEQNRLEFLSFYAAQKYASELMCQQFHAARSIPSIVFRFFNVYGFGQDPQSPYSGVISKFADAIHKKHPIRLNGGGVTTRDFIAIQDIVRALLLALSCPIEVCNGEPINLGSGKTCSIRELAELMMAVSGQKVALEQAPWREADVPHSLADIKLAFTKLGWQPKLDLRQGLTELMRSLS